MIRAASRSKNARTGNLSANIKGTTKNTEEVAHNSTVRNVDFPNIDFITHSLQKIDFIISTVHRLWPTNTKAEKIVTDAVEVMNLACKEKFSFCNGKGLTSLLAGLFYIFGFRYNAPKTQREIGITLQLTAVTVRSSYKRWLEAFPDLFQDEIKIIDQKLCNCTMGSDYDRRYSINI